MNNSIAKKQENNKKNRNTNQYNISKLPKRRITQIKEIITKK